MGNPFPPANPFPPGNSGGLGRPRGSRNKLSESFLDALYLDFKNNGTAAIIAARAESPLGYVRMIASLMPQKLELDRPLALSDDDLLQIVQAADAAALPAPTVPDVSGTA
jgi:hypothetical protein